MAHRTIKIKDFTDIRKEALADGAITPGHLLERTSAGKFKVHSSAGQNATRLFAIEDDLQGKEIGDAYATGARVSAHVFRTGDEVYALLADGQNVAIGDFLESAGDGTLRKHSASSASVVEYPEAVVAMALEAVDMSGSAGVDPSGRIVVEIV